MKLPIKNCVQKPLAIYMKFMKPSIDDATNKSAIFWSFCELPLSARLLEVEGRLRFFYYRGLFGPSFASFRTSLALF